MDMDCMNLMFKNNSASPFIQYFIIDSGIPTPAHITGNIFKALQNVVCLGYSRVPVLGVAVINSTFQQVLSLTNTQTQLTKILRSLKTVTDLGKCRARISLPEFVDNIHIGIKKAIEDVQYFTSKLDENEQCPSELQMSVFTMKTGLNIKCHIEDIIRVIPIGQLNKIRVVELLEDYVESDYTTPHSTHPGIVELIKVPGSALNLDRLLKQWLTDLPTERENVRLLLNNCIILCDTQECLILPDPPVDLSENESKSEIKVVDLEVIQRLSSDGLCETQVFGNPVVLVPTRCSQMDWDDRQLNHQHFTSLNEKIMSADEYLVAKYERKGRPVKYFVLMPGQGLMLVKCLVSAEMALPSRGTKYVQVTEAVDSRILDALMLLPTLESYQPSGFSSGLYRHLITSSLELSNTQMQQSLCNDPSHKALLVGIEIKKTSKNRKRKKTSSDLPVLSDSDQQTIKECLAKKKLF